MCTTSAIIENQKRNYEVEEALKMIHFIYISLGEKENELEPTDSFTHCHSTPLIWLDYLKISLYSNPSK